jgi:hypothetical protein
MSYECRNKCMKIEAKWGKIPGWPASPRPAGLALSWIATSLIQGQKNTLTLILRHALEVGLIQRPERLHTWIWGPTCMQDSGKHLRCPLPPTLGRNQRHLEEDGAKWHKSQADQRGRGRPASHFNATCSTLRGSYLNRHTCLQDKIHCKNWPWSRINRPAHPTCNTHQGVVFSLSLSRVRFSSLGVRVESSLSRDSRVVIASLV